MTRDTLKKDWERVCADGGHLGAHQWVEAECETLEEVIQLLKGLPKVVAVQLTLPESLAPEAEEQLRAQGFDVHHASEGEEKDKGQ